MIQSSENYEGKIKDTCGNIKTYLIFIHWISFVYIYPSMFGLINVGENERPLRKCMKGQQYY